MWVNRLGCDADWAHGSCNRDRRAHCDADADKNRAPTPSLVFSVGGRRTCFLSLSFSAFQALYWSFVSRTSGACMQRPCDVWHCQTLR